jgi:uncharacterized protein with von Willebrand factor type A (vWA) domain
VTLKHTAFRNLTFSLSGTSAVMHDATWDGEIPGDAPVEEWPSFARETFGRLYRPEDEQKPIDKPEEWAQRAHALLEQQAEWAGLRSACAGNALLAARAARVLEQGVRDVLGQRWKGANDASRVDPEEVRAQIEALRRMRSISGVSLETLDQAGEELAAALERAIIRRTAMKGEVEQHAKAGALASVVAAAHKEVEEAKQEQALLSSFGIQPGVHQADAEADRALMDLLASSNLLREILRAMGTMTKAHALRDLDRGRVGRCDVVGVHPGRDLTALTTTERSRLAHPTLRADVMRRAMDGAAMTWEMAGVEDDRNAGDVLLCVDRSGSMQGPRMIWARALTAAALARAHTDRRRTVLVLFADRATTVIVDSAAPTAKRDLLEALHVLSEGPSGGTDAPGAVRHSLGYVRTQHAPDLMVITDAEFGTTLDDMIAATAAPRAIGGHVVGVLIGSDEPAPWADERVAISDVQEGGTGRAVDALTHMFSPRD